MRQVFNYKKFNDVALDGMVETFHTLAEKYMEKKNNTPEYQKANAELNEQFMRYCVESIPGKSFSSLEDIKNPMVYTSGYFKEAFNAVLAQAITPIIPSVIAANYTDLYDVTQVGWGDNARYTVESNELFIVNDMAEGISRGAVQTSYKTEYTVQAKRQQIALFVDWYHVAAGKQDWGYMLSRIGDSYAAYVQAKVVFAMASCITNAAQHGISGYIANGFSTSNWVNTIRNVELANRGAQVYGFGTKIALMEILPEETATSPFRYGENSDIVRKGYLPAYKGTPLVELDNALIPNTQNTTPQVVVPDEIIYLIPMGWHKPVHVVVEGNSVSVSQDPMRSSDHTFVYAIDSRIGVDVVIGSKFGAINLT